MSAIRFSSSIGLTDFSFSILNRRSETRSRTSRPELAVPQQQQNVIGVVDLLLTPPVVAVVPSPDVLTVEFVELRSEHSVDTFFRVTADRGVTRIVADVLKVDESQNRLTFE